LARYFVKLFCKLKTNLKLKPICRINSPKLIWHILSFLINAFHFNQCRYFLYKFPCLCFNKLVLNWTFCQSLLCQKKNPIARNIFSLNLFPQFFSPSDQLIPLIETCKDATFSLPPFNFTILLAHLYATNFVYKYSALR
jgi:hypothetical protein